jgi:glycosyltransferase involved in cell wall biosynthesis
MSGGPTVAVVVPAYNVGRWIGETLESVFAQTDPADEVVVVDDGSADDTREVVHGFGDRVRLIEQPNAGCGAAFNAAIAAAGSEYVALCPADDVWVPEKLEWQRETLRAHPEVDVSFGAAVNFGASDAPFHRPSREGMLDSRGLLREMFVEHCIPDPSVVLRRALHQRLGGFVHPIGEDYELWMRAARGGAVFHFDPRVLVRLRQHGGNLSANAVAIHEMTLGVRRAAAADVGEPRLAARVIARNQRQVARARLGLGQVAASRSAYRDSLRTRLDAGAAVAVALLSLPGAEPVVERLNARRSARRA